MALSGSSLLIAPEGIEIALINFLETIASTLLIAPEGIEMCYICDNPALFTDS